MNVLLINLILTTAEKGVIARRESIKDTMICNFARGFVAAGHTVTIAAAQDFRPTTAEDYEFEVVYFASRWPKVFKPHLLPFPVNFGQWLRAHEREYDMVVTSEAFSIGTLMAARVCPHKLVIWQEMAYHQRMMLKLPSRFWYNVVARATMRQCLVVARSQAAQQFIAQYLPQVSPHIVDHGANAQVLYPGDEADEAFIVVSQLVPRKRVDTIINAFARLVAKPEYAHYKLHIVGDGDQAQALREQVKDARLERNVLFHGFLRHHEMAPLLRRAKAMLVNTSMDLNMVSIPEAIVSGTPVVTNTMPTTATFIAQNHLGIARDGWDENDLIDIIDHYDDYHAACVAVRDGLTNVGCAKRMVQIFNDWKKS